MADDPDLYEIDGVEYRGDLPVHQQIGVNKKGDGPVSEFDSDYDRTVCWCGDDNCEKYKK